MALDPIALSVSAVIGQLAEQSQRAYQADWDRYVAWLASQRVHVLEAKPGDVAAHIAELRKKGRKKPTTARALSALREIYRQLVIDGLLESNPAREVKNPRGKHQPNAPLLTEDQAQDLINVPAESWRDRRDVLAARILFGIGFRRAEVARITVEDFGRGIDKKGEPIMTLTGVIKGGKVLTVGVPPWLERDIAEWRAYAGIERGPLLPRSPHDRRPVSDNIIYKSIAALAARAGIKVSPHGLRRTYITVTGELGEDVRDRQLSVGHEKRATTDIYDHARDASRIAPGRVLEHLARPKRPT